MKRMMDIPLSLPVILGELQLSAREWLAIKVGDVLVLPRRVTDPVTVKVEDVPVYYARPGRVGNVRSVRILRSVSDGRQTEVSHLVR
jgi:flagellar motor switch protein FliM